MLVGHLYILFGELSIYRSAHFLLGLLRVVFLWFFVCFGIELQVVFINFGHESLVSRFTGKYVHPSVGCLFVLVRASFAGQKHLCFTRSHNLCLFVLSFL